MRYVTDLECLDCHTRYPAAPDRYRCDCGGLLEVCYDYSRLRQEWDRAALAADTDYSIWRYLPLLPVGSGPRPPLSVGWTPVYRSAALAAAIGLEQGVWLKDDGLNPTASLKDRASAVAVTKALEAGAQTIACASTGNAASSLAGNVASLGGRLQSVIFVPGRAPAGKIAQLLIFGAKVISVQGSYRDAFELSAAAIERWGWYNRNAAINPYLVEGKKTVALELAEQLDWQTPDWLAVSVGDGCTIAGVGKGFQDLKALGFIERAPRLLGVQAVGSAPIYRSFHTGKELEPAPENTLADSIAVGVPRNPHKAIAQVRRSQGTMLTVTDEEILAAMRLMGKTSGVFSEPAAAAALAGLAKAVKEGIVDRGCRTAVISSGNGLKDIANALKAAGEPLKVNPDIEQLAEVIRGE